MRLPRPWRRDPPPALQDAMRRELRDADAVMGAAGIGDEPPEPPWRDDDGEQENEGD